MTRRLAVWLSIVVAFVAIVATTAATRAGGAVDAARPLQRDGVTYTGTTVQEGASDSLVAVVPITGAVTGGDSSPDGSSTGAQDVMRQLDAIADDGGYDGVILELDTPGGGVLAAAEMHDAIERLRDDDVKVVAWMRDTAASAGYYVAAPADRIVAAPSTMTGSIGVILQYAEVSELADKVGVKDVTIKSGKLKDIGSPFRALSPEGRAVLQSVIDEAFDEFVDVVADGRELSEAEVRELADGRIYTGRQAVENGLVDELGLQRDAFEAMAGELGEKGDGEELDVVEFGRTYSLLETLGADVQPGLDSLKSIGDVAAAVRGDVGGLAATPVGNGFLRVEYRATL
ncbi:MAG: sppA [Thermoleophilia bacterium]|jgi:protease-4|nr:sppA [Thermoleophilia bacterium]